jgi:hypothetical protein
MKPHPQWVLAVLLAAPLGALAQGRAHVHGVGELDIALEPRQIVLRLESPLDNLVRFERAPRNDAERKRVDDALAKLRAGDTLFNFEAAAGCKLTQVALNSAALKLGPQGSAAAKDGHADLDAEWTFACTDAGKAAFVDVGLFAFAGFKRLQVQLALPKAQFKRELKRPQTRIVLGP